MLIEPTLLVASFESTNIPRSLRKYHRKYRPYVLAVQNCRTGLNFFWKRKKKHVRVDVCSLICFAGLVFIKYKKSINKKHVCVNVSSYARSLGSQRFSFVKIGRYVFAYTFIREWLFTKFSLVKPNFKETTNTNEQTKRNISVGNHSENWTIFCLLSYFEIRQRRFQIELVVYATSCFSATNPTQLTARPVNLFSNSIFG